VDTLESLESTLYRSLPNYEKYFFAIFGLDYVPRPDSQWHLVVEVILFVPFRIGATLVASNAFLVRNYYPATYDTRCLPSG
jgi:hypothetical protein